MEEWREYSVCRGGDFKECVTVLLYIENKSQKRVEYALNFILQARKCDIFLAVIILIII